MRLITTAIVTTLFVTLAAGCGGGTKTVTVSSSPKTTTTAAKTTATDTPTQTDTTGTETAKASADSMVRPDADKDGIDDVQTFRGKLGDSFVLVGQPGYKKHAKNAVKVTLLGVTGPFSGFNVGGGAKLIGLKVRFEGIGSERYDDAQPNGQLTVTGGETGKQTSLITGSGKNPCDNPSLKLRKGKSATSCLAFEIPKNAKPQVFQYGADSGYGDTAIWKFG